MSDDSLAAWYRRQKYQKLKHEHLKKNKQQNHDLVIVDFQIASKMRKAFFSSNRATREHLVAINKSHKLTRWLTSTA